MGLTNRAAGSGSPICRVCFPIFLAFSTVGLAGSSFAEEIHEAPVIHFVNKHIRSWLYDPLIVKKLKARNAITRHLTVSEILALDAEWRRELDAASHPMIDEALSTPLSRFLKAREDETSGTVTEIFVMDERGLNAGQSSITSDFWQGDEEKFTVPMKLGAGGMHVGEALRDESTQILQSQVSMTIEDETGQPIGVITIGINLDQL